MKIADLAQHKHMLLLGYGKEARATEQFLHTYVPNVPVTHADQTDGPDYLLRQKDADLVIRSHGVPQHLVTQKHTTAANIFFANVYDLVKNAEVIGVTGSKGKSTTSTLLAHVLCEDHASPVVFAGNIGTPMLSTLVTLPKTWTTFVLELSSYMLEDIVYAPDIAVLLNIFPEHLDHHGGFEAYATAKANITLHQTSQQLFVYNAENERVRAVAEQTSAMTLPFAPLPFAVDTFPLRGKHYYDDMRAVYTVAHRKNISDDVIARAFASFTPLVHRMQFVGEYGGIKWYDDAIATAPEPTIAAIETLGDVDTLFLGGTDRGLTYKKLADALRQSSIRNLVLFPDTGDAMFAQIQQACGNRAFNVLRTSSMKEAVVFAYQHTEKGKSCLLSCAAPSYTLWKNFEEKGEEFVREVTLENN